MHQHWLEGVDSFETNLYSGVPQDLFERFTQTWKIGDRNKETVSLPQVLCLGVLNLNLNLRHLYSTPHEPCEGFQVRFTLLAAQANHLTVSHQYEKEPPSPRSTPWGAYRSTSLMCHRSSFSQAFSAAIHTHTHTW